LSFLRSLLAVLGIALALILGARVLGTHAVPPQAPAPRPAKAATATTAARADRRSLLQRQPEILARALRGLDGQRPGHVDLFAVGFAGDGTEAVFRNEVEYFAELMARRFDAEGHVLALVNQPKDSTVVPLATLDNLREALAGVARHMDTEEDVLVLFMTSHGSREHELSVERPPLTLAQVRPRDLRQALDGAGIRWRVLVVSACYSGGFVPALRDPRTLVITAARQDRTSFGCGSESRITWFGDAFLAHALNETTDFQLAFLRARSLIAEWEEKQRDTPSHPQMSPGRKIGPKLAAWAATAKVGPPLPFPRR
jgi:hypothetical protein